MRVLMLGWEFPPLISGGLGTACEGLSRAMAELGMNVLFILPSACESTQATREAGQPRAMTFRGVTAPVRSPYPGSSAGAPASEMAEEGATGLQAPGLRVCGTGVGSGYQGDLGARIVEYANCCAKIAVEEEYDLIHAHDWMTFPAAARIAERSGKPWFAHVHATEFDRSGNAINPVVSAMEREGVHAATGVLAVSKLTKHTLVRGYDVPGGKVRVVHNGVAHNTASGVAPRADERATVLFVGRLTRQKAPHILVQAAEQVLAEMHSTRFIIAGKGELAPHLIEYVAAKGLGNAIFFTGFLAKPEISRAYRCADVYVMPSVSEPFGLTALEALQADTPAVISKTAGVAEVLARGALKVDWWDVDGWARAILAVLRDPKLAARLRTEGRAEAAAMSWHRAARQCAAAYETVIQTQ
ncbi:MAG: glycosyltransferase family 4 protein [bacterium]